MDSQAINHIKYVSKKNHLPTKVFNYLQNNGASNYDYDLVVYKIQKWKMWLLIRVAQ